MITRSHLFGILSLASSLIVPVVVLFVVDREARASDFPNHCAMNVAGRTACCTNTNTVLCTNCPGATGCSGSGIIEYTCSSGATCTITLRGAAGAACGNCTPV